MKKVLLCLATALILLLPMELFAVAMEADTADFTLAVMEEAPAVPTFTVNGVTYEDEALTVIDGVTYASLSTVALALREDITVSWENPYAVITADNLNLTARVGDPYIQANGRYIPVEGGVQSNMGRIIVPIRVIGEAMSAGVLWNERTGLVELYRGAGTTHPADYYYNQNDLYWLSRIIYAESGNQSLEGMLAVGAVVLNRVNSPLYPNNIYDVIFAPGQFCPTRNGSIYRTPNEMSVIAAKLCLEGMHYSDDIFYFLNPAVAANSWAARNRPYVTTIGAHAFYG